MEILQLYYTSCKKGLASGAGFQTYSMSEGITEEERQELERYCLYIPPLHLPTQPTENQIDTMFPTSFRFFQLKSGRYGVCQSKYTGKDYSGRFGNYFSHVLLSKTGQWPFHPIQLYDSESFRGGLTEAEKDTAQILPLSELKEVVLGEKINFETVVAFLNSHERIWNIKDMINALLNYEKSKRRIVIKDNYANNPYWIGALTMAVPAKLAHRVTFTTYSHEIGSANDLVTALADDMGNNIFNDVQRTIQYFIFDFTSKINSNVEQKTRLAQVVQTGYSVSKESLINFQDFLSEFNYDKLNTEADDCYNLFTIINRGLGNMDNINIIRAIQFADRYGSTEGKEQLLLRIEPVLRKISGEVDLQLAEAITRFLFRTGNEIKERDYTARAYEFLKNVVLHFLTDEEDIEVEGILEFFYRIRYLNQGDRAAFCSMFLNEGYFQELNTYLLGCKARHAYTYLSMILSNMIYGNYKWEEMCQVEGFRKLIYTCAQKLIDEEEKMNHLLDTASKRGDLFIGMVIMLYNALLSKQYPVAFFIKVFSKLLDEKDEKAALYIREAVTERKNGILLLYDEYKIRLSEAQDKSKFFWAYYEYTLRQVKNLGKRYFTNVFNIYLNNMMPEPLFSEECFKLLQRIIEEGIEVEEFVLCRIIEGCEREVTISSPEEAVKPIVRKMCIFKREKNIHTSPDVLGMVNLGIKLEEKQLAGTGKLFEVLESESFLLENIDGIRYKGWLEWCMIKFISVCTCIEHHGLIFHMFYDASYGIEFFSIYLNQLKENIQEDKEYGYENFLFFLICFFENATSLEEDSVEYAWHEIVHMLSSKTEVQLSQYNSFVQKRLVNRENKEMLFQTWKKCCRDAREKKEHSLPKRLMQLFRRNS